ncbi:MAG: MFS transporter [Bacteroidales bacterium]|nr:MFS transporter [Bacteroidales bacterium]
MSRLGKVIKKFPEIFWVSNFMELFERFAWYGFYNALAIYLTKSLGFTPAEQGIIMGTGSMLLYFLPTITGAIADNIGYKKVLIISFGMYISGFFMMAYFESFSAIFISFIYVAVAGALFKPIISGTIAKVTDDETSSIGFGIFYMMINIGGWLGPLIAGILMDIEWNYVFALSMGVMAINYVIVFIFYKEPVVKGEKKSLGKNIAQAFKNIGIALSDYKYLIFLILMIGYWTAFNQLYYTFPVFLDQWADLSGFGFEMNSVTMTSFDAFFIILFQLIISTVVMRFKPINSIISGLVVVSIGVGLMFSTQNGWFLLFAILVFAIGEMASSPKYTEYVGKIAPKDKVALYMGTSFLPIAVAHQLAGILSGSVYGKLADKVFLIKQEVESRGLSIPEISGNFTQKDYYAKAEQLLGMNQQDLTQFLWDTYDPTKVMYIFAGIGIITAVLLLLYDKLILKSKNNNPKR